MDKRYGLILIIIVVCCINLFIIANSSDVIGSASAECGNYIFTMPLGFSLYSSDGNHVLIHNPKNGINIDIYSQLGKSDTYENKIKAIESENFIIVSNGTITVEGIEVKSIFYTKNNDNRSTFFFEKDGNKFRILVTNFDLENGRNETIDYVVRIIESIHYNHMM